MLAARDGLRSTSSGAKWTTETKVWVMAIALAGTVLAGLLLGIEIGTGMAHQTAPALPEAAWTAMHQAEDKLIRVVIPPAFIFTILCWRRLRF